TNDDEWRHRWSGLARQSRAGTPVAIASNAQVENSLIILNETPQMLLQPRTKRVSLPYWLRVNIDKFSSSVSTETNSRPSFGHAERWSVANISNIVVDLFRALYLYIERPSRAHHKTNKMRAGRSADAPPPASQAPTEKTTKEALPSLEIVESRAYSPTIGEGRSAGGRRHLQHGGFAGHAARAALCAREPGRPRLGLHRAAATGLRAGCRAADARTSAAPRHRAVHPRTSFYK
ncbi:hypothetical protein EVAR_69913_1, partial [Eumeta japonica]